MSGPWRTLIHPDKIDVVAPDGAIRCRVDGYYGGTMFTVDDMTADIRPGDEIRRTLPNGREEAFTVLDPKFFKGGPFGSHYQIKVGRPNIYSSHTGGHYEVHVSGQNSRVNIGSTDNSMNVANKGDIFDQVKDALRQGVADEIERVKLVALVDDLATAKDQNSFGKKYQALIASVADHMTILLPFLPAITDLAKQLT